MTTKHIVRNLFDVLDNSPRREPTLLICLNISNNLARVDGITNFFLDAHPILHLQRLGDVEVGKHLQELDVLLVLLCARPCRRTLQVDNLTQDGTRLGNCASLNTKNPVGLSRRDGASLADGSLKHSAKSISLHRSISSVLRNLGLSSRQHALPLGNSIECRRQIIGNLLNGVSNQSRGVAIHASQVNPQRLGFREHIHKRCLARSATKNNIRVLGPVEFLDDTA